MNRKCFRKLRLPGWFIQGIKEFENCIGATQQTAPSQEEEEKEEEEEEHNEEDPIGRQEASDATPPAARYRDIKPANDCFDSIDWQMYRRYLDQ